MKNSSAAHEVFYGNVSHSTMMTKMSVMKNREVVSLLGRFIASVYIRSAIKS